jgi:hypothetical protein
MTRYYDQNFTVNNVGEFIEIRAGDVAFMLTVEQTKDLVAKLEMIVPKPVMILRPERPCYRVGD